MIEVLIPDISRPLYPTLMRGIVEALEQHGYTAILSGTDEDEQRERRLFATLRARRRGRVHPRHGAPPPSAPRRRGPAGHPHGGAQPDRRGRTRLVGGPRQARAAWPTSRRIWPPWAIRASRTWAGPWTRAPGSRARWASCGRSRARASSPSRRSRWRPRPTPSPGVRAARQLLQRGTAFSAIVTGNDLLALGVLDVLRENQIQVP
ncbi:MAG: hypothetical protein R3C32_01110 [Chloroflexota bacterium]